MRCVADGSLGPKLTTYSLHMAGWYVVRDRHGPTGGGMKGVGGLVSGPLGSVCMCQYLIGTCGVVKNRLSSFEREALV